MKPIDPPVRARTVEEVLSEISRTLPLSDGSTSGLRRSDHALISEDGGISTYVVDVFIDRLWDVYGSGTDGASGRARVRVRPCADGFEAFDIEMED